MSISSLLYQLNLAKFYFFKLYYTIVVNEDLYIFDSRVKVLRIFTMPLSNWWPRAKFIGYRKLGLRSLSRTVWRKRLEAWSFGSGHVRHSTRSLDSKHQFQLSAFRRVDWKWQTWKSWTQ